MDRYESQERGDRLKDQRGLGMDEEPSLYESHDVPVCFRKISLTISRMIWRGMRRKES